MGILENENRRIIRRTKVQESVLKTLFSGGRIGSDELLKNAAAYLLKIDTSSPSRLRDIVGTATSRLQRKGLVKFEGNHYSLTKSGENILNRWEREDFKFPKPKKWDKKWRIIISDIPEKKRKVRDEIRRIFESAGLRRIQDSVWIYPYDCEDIIGLLKTDYGIGAYMLYIIADQVENDKHLRMDFGLI